MMNSYPLKLVGLERNLPICKVHEDLYIAAFVIFGDVELTIKTAEAMVKIVPEHDYMITAEAKGIPLIHEMAKQMGVNKYFLARKSPKLYMQNPCSVEVKSITTEKRQVLYIDDEDVALMKGKKILLIDDVISTGESLFALEKLVIESGGIIAGKMAILAEGDAKLRTDIQYLAELPLFSKEDVL